ncbi:Flp pilus assembly protein CpaB [Phenylobacterium aquaticum]|uniref:Flp pilus assembly protein CpaB n=1 Tax=Phenylobacterium aquaticum TaxID=1763816 RepID=UPI0026F01E1B|nr:Flp pilus assembly protein CpaB [Phenylobacterium aquaticum]
MGAVRIAIIAAAALAAILLAFLVRGMVAPKKPPPLAAIAAAAAPPPRPMAQVLVAKHDLTVGARISPIDLTWQPWPVDALNPNFVTDGAAPAPIPDPPTAKQVAQSTARAAQDAVMASGPMQAFDGAIVKEAMIQGEPVIARKVVRGGQSGFMAVVLAPGMRAMSIPITAETAAGGFILPGDRVDVLQARAQPDGKSIGTETLMRNLRVLAIDQKTEPDKDARAIVGALAVLEVPATDVEVLARGKAQGEMQLVLRSYADLGGSATRGAKTRASIGMRVIRAGQSSEVAVQ